MFQFSFNWIGTKPRTVQHVGTPTLVRMLRDHTRKPRKPEPVMLRKVTLLSGPRMQGIRGLGTTHPGIVKHHVFQRVRLLGGPGAWMSRMSGIGPGPGRTPPTPPLAMIQELLVGGGQGRVSTTIVAAMIHTPLAPLARVLIPLVAGGLGILWGVLGGVGRYRIRQQSPAGMAERSPTPWDVNRRTRSLS